MVVLMSFNKEAKIPRGLWTQITKQTSTKPHLIFLNVFYPNKAKSFGIRLKAKYNIVKYNINT